MVRVLGKFGERIIQIINILATTVTVIAAVLNIFKFTKKSVFFILLLYVELVSFLILLFSMYCGIKSIVDFRLFEY